MKKTLKKVTAVIICFAFLTLVFPGIADAKPRVKKFNFKQLIRKPAIFLVSLLSYVPIYDIGSDYDRHDPSVKKINSRMRITGDLNKGRPSGDDGN